MSPAEQLRAAAAKLRDTAAKVEYGPPWGVDEDVPDAVVSGDLQPHGAPCVADADRGSAAWIALVSPALAEPLAAWLEDVAEVHQEHEADGADWCRYCAETWPCGDTKHARAVAAAILGEAP